MAGPTTSDHGWKPDWKLPPVPCPAPEACGPFPTCELCTAAKALFDAEASTDKEWKDLTEMHWEAWRREVAEA